MRKLRAAGLAIAALAAASGTAAFAQHHDIELRSQAYSDCFGDDWQSYAYATQEVCVEARYADLYHQRYGYYPPN